MRVLVACEFSGIVRDAFRALGHIAWSCDLLPTEKAGPHIQMDAVEASHLGWDLMIAHPPCTHLAVSGARWWKDRRVEQEAAIEFAKRLLDAPVPRIALESPVSILSTAIRKPDQTIQPWHFGHGETKATCLWLKELPKLQPTHLENDLFALHAPEKRRARVHRTPPRPDRWKERSRTLPGIAQAMALQWGTV